MKFYYPSCLWASGSDRSLTPSCLWASGSDRSLGRTFRSFRASIFFQKFTLDCFESEPQNWDTTISGLDLTKSLGHQLFDFDFFAWLTPHGVLHGTCGNSLLFRSLYPSSRGISIRVAERKRMEQESTTGAKKTHSETQNWLDQPIELVKAVTLWDR